ncbi:DUF7555 family protein [Halorhabdus rudnickae]|uniref:DUF7555 family protein n=1 Tax=Halorhabdus rudnickae TaxID=1775544 RepID=UPI001083A6CD|nr:hypothetical protein [Halorhabdus rudnickae]
MTRNALRYVEFFYWVGVVSGSVLLVLAVPAFLVGDGLLSLKYALFVVGFILFGVGSFAIQPSPRGRGPITRLFSFSVAGDSAFGFEQRLQELPPLEGSHLPIEYRVNRNVKLFVTSLVLLAISAVLEVWLGVTVG